MALNDVKAFGLIALSDAFDCPAAHLLQCAAKSWPNITAIGEDMTQPGVGVLDKLQHSSCCVTILNITTVNGEPNQQTIASSIDCISPNRRSLLRILDKSE